MLILFYGRENCWLATNPNPNHTIEPQQIDLDRCCWWWCQCNGDDEASYDTDSTEEDDEHDFGHCGSLCFSERTILALVNPNTFRQELILKRHKWEMIGKTIRLDKAWEKWTSKAHGHALTRVTLVSVTPVSLQHHHLYHLYILAEVPKNLKELA